MIEEMACLLYSRVQILLECVNITWIFRKRGFLEDSREKNNFHVHKNDIFDVKINGKINAMTSIFQMTDFILLPVLPVSFRNPDRLILISCISYTK